MYKIVLSGGPCAGKTTSISKVKRELQEKLGLYVFVVPEAATSTIQQGISPGSIIPMDIFQEYVFKQQIHMENMVVDAIEKYFDPDKSVIILDRGILDQYAYAPAPVIDKVLEKHGMTPSDAVKRYDMVIHMVTAAKGTNAYQTANNSARRETAEEAIELDEKTLEANKRHGNLVVIDNSTGFDEKVDRVVAAIFGLVGAPAPIEVEKRFLIKKPDANMLLKICSSASDIIQTYLKENEDGAERKIRQSRDKKRNYGVTFTYTEKSGICGVKKVKKEKLISMQDYVDFMSEADTKMFQIRKERFCFRYEGQYFELDIYDNGQELPFECTCAIMEIKLQDEGSKIKIPDFIEVVKEVTDDDSFKNHSIAAIKSNM